MVEFLDRKLHQLRSLAASRPGRSLLRGARNWLRAIKQIPTRISRSLGSNGRRWRWGNSSRIAVGNFPRFGLTLRLASVCHGALTGCSRGTHRSAPLAVRFSPSSCHDLEMVAGSLRCCYPFVIDNVRTTSEFTTSCLPVLPLALAPVVKWSHPNDTVHLVAPIPIIPFSTNCDTG